MSQRPLVRLAHDAEDAASGLRVFRDSLPRNATRITGIIGQFFAISSSLQQLDNAEADARYQPAFYRIRNDVDVLVASLQGTIRDVFSMFGRSREIAKRLCWEDLEHKMEDEGEGLLQRLDCYQDFLLSLFDVVRGRQPAGLLGLKRQLDALYLAQAAFGSTRPAINASGM
jgi:hypothetical protein